MGEEGSGVPLFALPLTGGHYRCPVIGRVPHILSALRRQPVDLQPDIERGAVEQRDPRLEPLARVHHARDRAVVDPPDIAELRRSKEHTSELQSLMAISFDAFCWKKKQNNTPSNHTSH